MKDEVNARVWVEHKANKIAAATLSQLNYFVLPNDNNALHMQLPLEVVEARMAVRESLKTLGFDTSAPNADVTIKGWENTAINDFTHTGAFLSFSQSGVDKLASAGVKNPVLDAVRERSPFGAVATASR